MHTKENNRQKCILVLMIITPQVGWWVKFVLLRLLVWLGPTPLSSLGHTIYFRLFPWRGRGRAGQQGEDRGSTRMDNSIPGATKPFPLRPGEQPPVLCGCSATRDIQNQNKTINHKHNLSEKQTAGPFPLKIAATILLCLLLYERNNGKPVD